MGFIGTVISTERSNDAGAPRVIVKILRDGLDPLTFEMIAAPGDDSLPLPSDFCGAHEVDASGGFVAGGFTDSKNAGIALDGEKRIYSRDAAGVIHADVHLKNDGAIAITNDVGSISLAADGALSITNGPGSISMATDGTVNINGATISPIGDVKSATGVSLSFHTTAGSPTAPSGPVSPTGLPIPTP